jgi:hypothetical protein
LQCGNFPAIQRYRQFEAAVRKLPFERLAQRASVLEGPLTEIACAENRHTFFAGVPSLPVPEASAPDF